MSGGNGPQSLGELGGIWAALLDFATRVGSTDIVNQTPSTYHQMSEQDREFLANAMASYMREGDPVRQLKEQLDVLMNLEYRQPNEEQIHSGVAALEIIIDLCCSLDLATDFHKLGGFRILVPLLASGAHQFRTHGAQLIGELAQNHAYCQKQLHSANILNLLLQLMDADPELTVRTKALFAVSCLIRNNEDLEKEFMSLDGLKYLLRAAVSDNERLHTKAAFLLSAILRKPEHKEKAIDIGMIDQLVSMLSRQTESRSLELTTSALLALVDGCPRAIEICKSDLGLKRMLEDRLKLVSSDPAAEEECEDIKHLLKICWPSN